MARITERKEVTHVEVEDVLIGRKCDICGKDILPLEHDIGYNYFCIATHHHDWGNDSVESWDHKDACCPDCVMTFTDTYIRKAFERHVNSKEIEIKHCRTLGQGSPEYY
ncbi:MAG: hypothetical protein LIR46_02910 [Bacteroidota bacterium]|nr:hypothetical protein [Bacteroidota bacterium]